MTKIHPLWIGEKGLVPARACAHQLTRVRTRARARRVRIGVADQVKKNSGHRARAKAGWLL
jgi:hypothetical protein